MKRKLLKISAKESFLSLKRDTLFCPLLKSDIKITNLFLKHIYFGSNKRSNTEIETRLLLIPLIKTILLVGKITDIRKKNSFIMMRFETKYNHIPIALILTKKINGKNISLLSCFLSKNKKRPISTSNGLSSSRLLGLIHPKNISKNKESQILSRTFQRFLKTQNLKNQKILLMVSGGVDSMVLLDIASKIIDKKNIAVFHLDHNLRNDSEKDLKFVQKICSKSGIKFYSEKLDSSKSDKNLENNWRKQRQKFSQKYAKDFGAKVILTAHHATDLVETMIFRLTKGCGISGLAPFDISSKPFWDIPKTELLSYAETNKLKWREDSSNLDTNFQRNQIRQNILPYLRKITPNLEKVFVKESIIFEEVEDFLSKQIPQNKNKISLKDFLELHSVLQEHFLRNIAQKTPSFSEVKDCLKWLRNKPQGNSKKEIGNTEIKIKKGEIVWD